MGQRGARNRRAEGAAFGGRHVNFLHLKYFLMVAEELNISTKTVDAQLQKALTRLKEALLTE